MEDLYNWRIYVTGRFIQLEDLYNWRIYKTVGLYIYIIYYILHIYIMFIFVFLARLNNLFFFMQKFHIKTILNCDIAFSGQRMFMN